MAAVGTVNVLRQHRSAALYLMATLSLILNICSNLHHFLTSHTLLKSSTVQNESEVTCLKNARASTGQIRVQRQRNVTPTAEPQHSSFGADVQHMGKRSVWWNDECRAAPSHVPSKVCAAGVPRDGEQEHAAPSIHLSSCS